MNDTRWTPEQAQAIEREYDRRGAARCPVDGGRITRTTEGFLGEPRDRHDYRCSKCPRRLETGGSEEDE